MKCKDCSEGTAQARRAASPSPSEGGDVPGGVSWIVLGKENKEKLRYGTQYLASK